MSRLLFWSVLSFFAGFIFAPLLFFPLAVVLWVFGTFGLVGELGEAFDARCGRGFVSDMRAASPQPTRLGARRWPPSTGWKHAQLKRRRQTFF